MIRTSNTKSDWTLDSSYIISSIAKQSYYMKEHTFVNMKAVLLQLIILFNHYLIEWVSAITPE